MFIRIPGYLGKHGGVGKDVLECLDEINEKLQIPYIDICERCLILSF